MPEVSVLVQIFFGYVILRHFARAYLLLWIVFCLFYARHDASLESISFLDQVSYTFRISSFSVTQTLQISRHRF